MPTTFTKIASVSVGVLGAATIDFTAIPSTYTDLVLKFSGRSNRVNSNDGVNLTFNATGGTAYSTRRIYAFSTTPASDSLTSNAFIYADPTNAATSTGSTFNNSEVYIPNYAGSTNKSISLDASQENNASSPALVLAAGLWSNTAAITQVSIKPDSGSWVQYTTATLYGVSKS